MIRTALALTFSAALATTASAAPLRGQLVRPNLTPNRGGGSTLSYNGGPVLQNVKVFTIYWGKSVQFSGTGAQGLDSFYAAVIQSPYYDWLSEYNTTNPTQKIGRGSFIGSYAYTKGQSGSITDDDIQTALKMLIGDKSIPAPDANTLYAIHFAPGIDITMSDGSASCQVFCAYHNSFSNGNANVYYSVVPDQGGNCAGGCGGDPSLFNNVTSVASHELVEATTDADVGNNNIAWYNDSQGEIGDICNGQQCSSTVGKTDPTWCPTKYVVQLEWSNSQNACIAIDPSIVVNDFSVAATPTMVTVPAGGMTTVSLALAKTSGSADNVTLSATAPADLMTSFSPTSATSDGGKSTLTISAMANAMVGNTEKVTVQAAGTSVNHTVDLQVMVTAPPDMAMAPPDMAMAPSGNGNGGNGSGGNGTGGNGATGGNGVARSSGCSMGGAGIAGSWVFATLLLFAFALRRRRA